MKNHILVFLLLIFAKSFAQNNVISEISLSKKLLIAEIKNNKIHLKVDADEFIKTYNKEAYLQKQVIKNLEVIVDYTMGDFHEKYYYLHLWSEYHKIDVARWLFVEGNNLYIDFSNDPEIYTYKDLYISCEGFGKCSPHLFIVEDEYFWNCEETVTECKPFVEGDSKNRCQTSKTIFSD